MDKEVKMWDVFTGLDALVKNMMTSLRAVGELQNSAIRERHWEEVMVATQVRFVFVTIFFVLSFHRMLRSQLTF